MKDLVHENARLTRSVIELMLHTLILKDGRFRLECTGESITGQIYH